MRIYRVQLSKDLLQSLPQAERNFMFLAGHMLNELNSLHKGFAWSMAGHRDHAPANPLEGTISAANAFIYARLLAGKEWEAWEAIGKDWFRTKICQPLEPLLPTESQAALKALKSYFSSKNLINSVRNSFAFHYSADAVGEHWERASEEPFFETVLGGNIGNNFYLAAEIAVNVSLFGVAHPSDLQTGMKLFLDEVSETSKQLIAFLEGVNIAIYKSATGQPLNWDVGTPDDVHPLKPFADVTVPHFCSPDLEPVKPIGEV